MTGRRRGFWWMLAGIVIAVAVGFCAWFARDLFLAPRVLKPGEGYTDPLGVTYTVVSREVLDELPDGSSGTIRPVAGVVFLRYTVAVDNFVYVEQDDRSTICSFELLSASGDVWEDKANYDPMRDRICRLDSDEITPSQQVVASFEVPEQLVDQAVGLISNTVTYGLFPVISPAR